MGFMGDNRRVLDDPQGYHSCCGVSRLRGHPDTCHNHYCG